MRLVPATDQSSAGMGGVTNALTGAHGGGTASSLRIAGTQPPQRPVTGQATGQATEFTLRMDNGFTMIVVQGDDQGLLPGDQVRLVPGDRTRVARAE
jgi:outer membrane lipoprotein SlyB